MKPIFRTSMFGFSKEDVFNFITKQNRQYDLKRSELISDFEKQKAEFYREKESFLRDTSEIERLRKQLDDIRLTMKEISDVVQEISSDKSRVYDCALEVLEERDKDREIFNAMKSRAVEAEKLRDKAEKFDRLSGVLSSIFNQTDASVQSNAIIESESVKEDELSNRNSVSDLIDFIEVLSSRCDKLQELLSKEKGDA